MLPPNSCPVTPEAIREWFRRAEGREPTEKEIREVQDQLAHRGKTSGDPSGPRTPSDPS